MQLSRTSTLKSPRKIMFSQSAEINLKIRLISWYEYSRCLYENNLKTICHFANLILHKSLLLVYFLLQVDGVPFLTNSIIPPTFGFTI